MCMRKTWAENSLYWFQESLIEAQVRKRKEEKAATIINSMLYMFKNIQAF